MNALQPPPVSLLDKYQGQVFRALYSTTVTVSGGQAEHGRASGIARSDDGMLELDLRMPAALGGPGGGTNPEQLFAAGYAACFHGALSLLAAKSGIVVHGMSVEVSVAFGRDPVDGLFMLTATLCVHLPGVQKRAAEELVRNTERICPYAKLTKQGIVSLIALAPSGTAADTRLATGPSAS